MIQRQCESVTDVIKNYKLPESAHPTAWDVPASQVKRIACLKKLMAVKLFVMSQIYYRTDLQIYWDSFIALRRLHKL